MYKSVFQKSRYLSSVAFPGIVLLFSVLPGYATDYITKIDGTYPATILNGGDTVTVSGTGPNAAALSSIGAGSAIIVNGGGIIASNTNGTGGGVVRTDTGGYIDLGTGSVINGTGFGSASGMMGATGIEANDVGSAVTARDVTISLQSDYSHGVYSRNSGSITLYGNTTVNIANNDGANNSGAYGLVTLNSGASITAENADITITGISGDYAGFHKV